MAMIRKYSLNNIPVQPPKNAPETTIKFNFEKDALDANGNRKLALSITDFEWVRENSDTLRDWINKGKVFSGMPFKYELERGGTTEKVFDGYLDLSDPSATFSPLSSTAPAKERQSIDWLNDVADSVSFEYLHSIGTISDDDYKFMPYILNSSPDYMQAAIATVSVFFMEEQIRGLIKELSGMIADLGNPLTAINTTIKAVLYLAYIIAFIVALIAMIKSLVKFVIQPVKYHACMKVKTILDRGASHFGFTFESDILEKDPFDKLVFMPEKYYNPLDTATKKGAFRGIFGFMTPQKVLQRGYPSGTFGDFLRSIKKTFRAKVVIDGTVLRLVPEYENTGASTYKLPDLDQPMYTTNAHELKSNYLLSFQTDISDKNTIQEYLGTSFQVITTPVTVVDPTLNLLKGLDENQLPFALAKTKTTLTEPELIFSTFEKVFDKITNVLISISNGVIAVYNAIAKTLNKIIKALRFIGIKIKWKAKVLPKIKKVPIGGLFENRIGMMKIEIDTFTVPKIFLMSEGSQSKYNKIATNNNTVVSARYLWDNYHAQAVSFLPSANRPNGNQYLIKNFDKVPFTFTDFQKVRRNNNIFTAQNKQAIIDNGEWNDWNEQAKLTVRISQMYTLDANGNQTIKETYLEPDGR